MRRFWSDRKGNVAVLFALAIVPMVGAVGAAVDYSMASAYRADMQQSVDSTALALSKILPASQETLDKVGLQYFRASMNSAALTALEPWSLTVTPGNGTVVVLANGSYKPTLVKVLGVESFGISARSRATWNLGKVEVALVLDNSLSMQTPNPERIIQLKAATHDLLTVLESSAKNPGDAKVAVVPFDGNVKVVATPVDSTWITNNTSWIRWDLWDADWGTTHGSCSKSGSNNQSDCEGTGTCSKSQYTSKSSCQSHSGTWTPATWTPQVPTNAQRASNWTGCVQDRDKDPSVNYDANDTAPSSTETKYPAWQCYNGALSPIMPLNLNWGAANSNDQTTLHGKVNGLTPTGYTNITIGLVWGLHALSSTSVLTEGVTYGTPNVTKIVVLLTDGDNTRNRFTSCGIGSACPAIDARTTALCQTLRDASIQVYTVRLIEGNADLLRGCATVPSMFYDVQQASQLSGVFKAIGGQIAQLHLSQ